MFFGYIKGADEIAKVHPDEGEHGVVDAVFGVGGHGGD